jgi:hypothetical protein
VDLTAGHPPRDRTAWLLAVIVLACGLVVAVVAAAENPYVFQFYGDANSRLVQTRMLVDAPDPGLHWIGSVWLPLPGLLFLPFALVDSFFFTGLAGLAVGLPLLALMTALLFRLLMNLTGDRVVAAGLALAAALNPNLLYISMTAMTETTTLFFVVAAVLGWTTWVRDRHRVERRRALVWGSLAAAAATLCRYEAWPFVLAGVSGLALFVLRLRRPLLARAGLLATVALSFVGIVLWLCWNWTQFGDPLHFHRAEYYSAAWQALRRPVRDAYYLQLGNSLGIYTTTLVAVFGYLFLTTTVVGGVLMGRVKPTAETGFLVANLQVMPLFTLLSLYIGDAEMTRWWNSRYVLLLAPFVAVTSAVALARWGSGRMAPRRMGALIAGAFIATSLFQMKWEPGRVVTVADAEGGFYYRQTPGATEVGELLRREWRAGRVLCATGSGQAHRIIQPSHVAVKQFVVGLNHDRYLYDVDALDREFAWIVVGLEPSADGAELAAFLREHSATLEQKFERVHTNEFYVVYRTSGVVSR